MFDIKREVASPAASKEEEDEEDEVKAKRECFRMSSLTFFTLFPR